MINQAAGIFLRFFKSVRLALILIAYLVLTSIAATLIPQGRDAAYYSQAFSPFLSRLIIFTRFNTFFRSLLFLVPGTIFFINLLVCTVYRIVSRIKRKVAFRPGPDIIHIGLLIVMIAGVITLFGRKEGFTSIAPGDSVRIPGGYELTLDSFTYAVYEDGRPKDWISEVTYGKPGGKERTYTIRVNKPFKAGRYNIFQYSYRDLSTITFTAVTETGEEKSAVLHPGDTIRTDKGKFQFVRVGTDPSGLVTFVSRTDQSPGKPRAVFYVTGTNGRTETVLMEKGNSIGDYVLTAAVPSLETGLQIVFDPGFTLILAGLLIMAAGLAVTFWRKKP